MSCELYAYDLRRRCPRRAISIIGLLDEIALRIIVRGRSILVGIARSLQTNCDVEAIHPRIAATEHCNCHGASCDLRSLIAGYGYCEGRVLCDKPICFEASHTG